MDLALLRSQANRPAPGVVTEEQRLHTRYRVSCSRNSSRFSVCIFWIRTRSSSVRAAADGCVFEAVKFAELILNLQPFEATLLVGGQLGIGWGILNCFLLSPEFYDFELLRETFLLKLQPVEGFRLCELRFDFASFKLQPQ